MGPDPTRAYFWPGYFNSDPIRRDFLDPKGKKLKNLMFLGEIFQTQTQTMDGWPNLTRATKNWPYPTHVKKFWPRPITMRDCHLTLRPVKKKRHPNSISLSDGHWLHWQSCIGSTIWTKFHSWVKKHQLKRWPLMKYSFCQLSTWHSLCTLKNQSIVKRT